MGPVARLEEQNAAARTLGLRTGWSLPLQFVGPDAAPAGEAYEHFIARTGCVPTRPNRHDHFNAMVWLRFPRTKARLNALQANAIRDAQSGRAPHGQRGAVRDWATHWDEMGMVIACDRRELAAQVGSLLAAHDWHGLLVEPAMRGRWGREIHALPFGHALMERWLPPAQPHKGLTAKCWVLHVSTPEGAGAAAPAGWFDAVDGAMEGAMERAMQTGLPRLLPLPVLGVPGMCEGNADPDFYADGRVFRTLRPPKASSPPSM